MKTILLSLLFLAVNGCSHPEITHLSEQTVGASPTAKPIVTQMTATRPSDAQIHRDYWNPLLNTARNLGSVIKIDKVLWENDRFESDICNVVVKGHTTDYNQKLSFFLTYRKMSGFKGPFWHLVNVDFAYYGS